MDLKTELILIAVMLAVLGLVLPINDNSDFKVNNTNMAPTIEAGPQGTGERILGNTYTTTSTKEIFVLFWSDVPNQDALVLLSINGVIVDARGLGSFASSENKFITVNAIIPANSNYSIQAINLTYYEWREYKSKAS